MVTSTPLGTRRDVRAPPAIARAFEAAAARLDVGAATDGAEQAAHGASSSIASRTFAVRSRSRAAPGSAPSAVLVSDIERREVELSAPLLASGAAALIQTLSIGLFLPVNHCDSACF